MPNALDSPYLTQYKHLTKSKHTFKHRTSCIMQKQKQGIPLFCMAYDGT